MHIDIESAGTPKTNICLCIYIYVYIYLLRGERTCTRMHTATCQAFCERHCQMQTAKPYLRYIAKCRLPALASAIAKCRLQSHARSVAKCKLPVCHARPCHTNILRFLSSHMHACHQPGEPTLCVGAASCCATPMALGARSSWAKPSDHTVCHFERSTPALASTRA